MARILLYRSSLVIRLIRSIRRQNEGQSQSERLCLCILALLPQAPQTSAATSRTAISRSIFFCLMSSITPKLLFYCRWPMLFFFFLPKPLRGDTPYTSLRVVPYNIYIFFLRRIYKSISCGYCQVHTIPIPSLYHLYTKSMVTREYLRCTASVPSVFLRPSYTLGISIPRPTLTRWVCLGYARSLATAFLQYG